MDKAKKLHGDIIHDAPITGSQSVQDVASIAFFNEDTDRPMIVTDYIIHDGQLRIWVQERDWSHEELSIETPQQLPPLATK